jgi:hypothetical protein
MEGIFETHRRTTRRKESRTANRRLAKVAVQCSADTFVVNQTFVVADSFVLLNCKLLVAANRFNRLGNSKNKKSNIYSICKFSIHLQKI